MLAQLEADILRDPPGPACQATPRPSAVTVHAGRVVVARTNGVPSHSRTFDEPKNPEAGQALPYISGRVSLTKTRSVVQRPGWSPRRGNRPLHGGSHASASDRGLSHADDVIPKRPHLVPLPGRDGGPAADRTRRGTDHRRYRAPVFDRPDQIHTCRYRGLSISDRVSAEAVNTL